MTREPLAELLAQFQEDEKLQDKLKAVATPDGQIAVNGALSIAKEAGFVISSSDLAKTQELTEEQLQAVTGGDAAHAFAYGWLSAATLGILPAIDGATGWQALHIACGHINPSPE